MMSIKLNKINSLIVLALFLIFFPVIIFLFGFIKWYYACIGTFLIFLGSVHFMNKLDDKQSEFQFNSINYYCIILLIIFIWVLFSGIGSFSYQNSDFNVRNAILRDLIIYDWPIYFDMTEMLGIDKVGLVYYFTFWMPSALVGKLFGLTIANIFLLLYSVLFLFVIYMLLEIILKKSSYWILFFLIMFSGLDVLGQYILNGSMNEILGLNHIEWWNSFGQYSSKSSYWILFFLIMFSGLDVLGQYILNGSMNEILGLNHIEWWNSFGQYSSNTTQLYWVFNQSLPIWLITELLLLNRNLKVVGFIGATAFCYSPWATFGVLPIAFYFLIHLCRNSKEKLREIFTISNIIYPLFILTVFGLFYLSTDSSSVSLNGFIWEFVDYSYIKFIMRYVLFVFVEVGIYFILLFKDYKKYNLFKLIMVLLIVVPLYKMTPANDFCMRTSIMPLFILMIFTIHYF